MKALAPAEVLFLHAQIARRLGAGRGVADLAAWRAVLAEAAAAEGGLFEVAAAQALALARHRPFRAANRAVAVAAAALLLRQYDLDLCLTPAEAPALRALLDAADRDALAAWLRAHTVPRPLT